MYGHVRWWATGHHGTSCICGNCGRRGNFRRSGAQARRTGDRPLAPDERYPAGREALDWLEESGGGAAGAVPAASLIPDR